VALRIVFVIGGHVLAGGHHVVEGGLQVGDPSGGG
jgi:hypothetical protein